MKSRISILLLAFIALLLHCSGGSGSSSDNSNSDKTGPSVISVSPAVGSTLFSLNKMSITFSEPLNQPLRPENISFSGSAATGCIILQVVEKSDFQFEITVDNTSQEGDLLIGVINVSDRAGNEMSATTINYFINNDNLVLSTNPILGSTVKELTLVDIEYTSNIVGAAHKDNYSVEGPGRGNLSVQAVTPLGGNLYRLSLIGSPSNGNFQIVMKVSGDLGNYLNQQTVPFVADTKKPGVASAESKLPRNSLQKISLSYSEPIIGADILENYAISGSGTGSLVLEGVKFVDDNSYELTLTGEAVTGGITLSLQNISDLAGNTLDTPALSYTIDKTNPTFSATPNAGSAVNALPNLLLTFSEAVNGAGDTASYQLSGSGMGECKIGSISNLGANKYRINFSGSLGNGSVSIKLIGITDSAGNSVAVDTFQYTADTIKPGVTTTPANNAVFASIGHVDLDFTEAVIGASITGNYTISGSGKGTLQPGVVTQNSPTSFRLSLTGIPENGTIELNLANIHDEAGNAVNINKISFSCDKVHPQFTTSPAKGALLSNLASLTVEFNETVVNADIISNYSLDGTGSGTLVIAGLQDLGNNRYELQLTGAPSEGEAVLTVQNVSDMVDNPVVDNKATYRFDLTPPAIINSYPSDGYATASLDVIPQIVFSEELDPSTVNASTIKLSFNGTPVTGTVSLAENHCYFRPDALLPANKSFVVTVTNQVKDIAGNNISGTPTRSFTTSAKKSISILEDIYAGTGSSEPGILTPSGNDLYFVAYKSGIGRELWKYDSATSTTFNVINLYQDPVWPSAGDGPSEIAAINGTVYFDGLIYNSGYGVELFRSDGTVPGTYMVKDIYTGEISSAPESLTVMNSILYFTARPSDFNSSGELYRSDGTAAGTTRVKVITNSTLYVRPYNLTPVNSLLYLVGRGSGNKFVLWASDGTESGTNEIRDIKPVKMKACGSDLCFTADDGIYGTELWKSSGSYFDTGLIKDINPSGNSNPDNIAYSNGKIFFTADDGVHGNELWVSDGTDAGTSIVADLTPGAVGSKISNITAFSGKVFFGFTDGNTNVSYLYHSDGTEAATFALKKIDVKAIAASGSALYIKGANSLFGTELWLSDGTMSGTFILSDINPGSANSLSDELVVVGDTVFFESYVASSGFELWRYQAP